MEALELLVRQAVSLDVVVVFELQRLAEKAAASVEGVSTIEVLPGLLARSLASRGGLGGGLHSSPNAWPEASSWPGPTVRCLKRAVGGDGARRGRRPVQTDVTVDAGSAPLAELRFYRQRPLRCAERRVLEQCASVIALELLRQRSALEAEERLGCDLFRELVDGGVEDERGLRHRASLLSLNLPPGRAAGGPAPHGLTGSRQAGLGERDICIWSALPGPCRDRRAGSPIPTPWSSSTFPTHRSATCGSWTGSC